jgi:hypothetical protein
VEVFPKSSVEILEIQEIQQEMPVEISVEILAYFSVSGHPHAETIFVLLSILRIILFCRRSKKLFMKSPTDTVLLKSRT